MASNHPLEQKIGTSYHVGDLVAFFTGDYSDRRMEALLRVTSDFDTASVETEANRRFGSLRSTQGFSTKSVSWWWCGPSATEFIDFLVHKGLVERLEFDEWDLPEWKEEPQEK